MTVLLRYRTWKPPGREPDPARALRNEPVRRAEVRFKHKWIGRNFRFYELLSMPIGTFRLEERRSEHGYIWHYFGGIPGLWQPLWDAVAAELAETFAREQDYNEMDPITRRLLGAPLEWKLRPKPELGISAACTREYTCERCGRDYLGGELTGNQHVCVCSNHCEQERERERQRQYRQTHPVDPLRRNATRTARRAEARTGRSCEHCGAPIDAARSTKRFCSDICRVRAHRNPAP